MNETSKEVAKIILSVDAVQIQPEKPFTYTSGLKSPIYTDMRMLISFPRERKRIVELLIDEANNIDSFSVYAGTATAGIPWASFVSYESDMPSVYVRGKAKAHGKGNQIEGIVQDGQKVLVIEDLVSTGGSSLESIQALREKNLDANNVLCIFNYALAQSKANFDQAGVSLISLTTFSDVVQEAIEQKIIRQEEKELVLDWAKDPDKWAERHGL